MNNTDIICFCSNVTKGQIIEAIQNGAETLDDIRRMTNACTVGNCKELSPRKRCCSPDILAILNEYSRNSEEEQFMPSCCKGANQKQAAIEYLYLDLSTCDRCIGTDSVLEEVVAVLTPALELAGYPVTLNKVEITSLELAKQYSFQSSPTIRVNGRDICLSVEESSCDCCSEISGTKTDCRVFRYEGTDYEVPPKEMLAEGILQALFAADCSCCTGEEYTVPDNLIEFFQGKNAKG